MSLLTRVLLFTYNCYHIIVIIIIAITFTIIEKLNLKLPIMFRYSDFFLTFFFLRNSVILPFHFRVKHCRRLYVFTLFH